MASNVIPIRRDFLPDNVFKMVEDYMHGKLITIHIVGVTDDGRVISTSAGNVPASLARHDDLKKQAQ